jgi:4-hydroxy-tetrahydrodipicolinate reductase
VVDGNVGRYALRHVIDHPELELVGLWVHGAAKAGKDAGELCDRPRTGVEATTDADALLALAPDCVCYTATADLRPFEAIEDMCRILAAGANVVSSSVVPLVHPKSFFPEVVEKLAAACAEGRSSFFTSGIDPASRTTSLPLVLSGLAGRWDEIRVQEIINYATYDQPTVIFETMGFGPADGRDPAHPHTGTLAFAWGGTIRLLAEGLGVELEEIRRFMTAPRREAGPHRRADGGARHHGGAPLRGAGHRRREAGDRRRARDAHRRRPRARLAAGSRQLPRARHRRSRHALRVRVLGRAR